MHPYTRLEYDEEALHALNENNNSTYPIKGAIIIYRGV
jgi:hypothetical protein